MNRRQKWEYGVGILLRGNIPFNSCREFLDYPTFLARAFDGME
jgi:hypothetical protein